jgi:hypothetical protein
LLPFAVNVADGMLFVFLEAGETMRLENTWRAKYASPKARDQSVDDSRK